jgi:hypothetical protein
VRRREFIAGLGGAAAWLRAALAQQQNQIKRIAYIAGSAEQIFTPVKRELAKLGWVEGHNMRIDTLFILDSRILRAAAPFVVSSTPTSSSRSVQRLRKSSRRRPIRYPSYSRSSPTRLQAIL